MVQTCLLVKNYSCVFLIRTFVRFCKWMVYIRSIRVFDRNKNWKFLLKRVLTPYVRMTQISVVYVVGYSFFKLHSKWILRSYPYFYSIKSEILRANCVDSYKMVIILWHFTRCSLIKFLKTSILGSFFFLSFLLHVREWSNNPTPLGSLAELSLNHRQDFQRGLV
jgi:hypothetical protein